MAHQSGNPAGNDRAPRRLSSAAIGAGFSLAPPKNQGRARLRRPRPASSSSRREAAVRAVSRAGLRGGSTRRPRAVRGPRSPRRLHPGERRRPDPSSTLERPMTAQIIGVDIGSAGAVALLREDGALAETFHSPCLSDGPAGRRAVNGPLLAEIIAKSHATKAYVE